MEYIILQPIQTNNEKLNVSIIERKYQLSREEESLILHEAGGPFAGFIIKKMIPNSMHIKTVDTEKAHLYFKLNVYVKHANKPDIQQEQRTIQFWFSTESSNQRLTYSNSFFHNLFKGDNFPRDYFNFLLKGGSFFNHNLNLLLI
jgi:hypothetical protein